MCSSKEENIEHLRIIIVMGDTSLNIENVFSKTTERNNLKLVKKQKSD